MKILIPNATSPKNTGDQAMLASLLALVHKALPQAEIRIHSVDPILQKKLLNNAEIETSLLSWLMFEKPKFRNRAVRSIQAILGILFPLLISNKKLKVILRDYKKSDVIIFVGNGYLRSTKGISQSVLLLLQLVPFALSKLNKKPVIVGPISFGPFAQRWQEKLVANVLSSTSTLFIREEISLNLAHKQKLAHARLAADLALLLPHQEQPKTEKSCIGVSLRNWYTPRAQKRFEHAVFTALIAFAKQTGETIKLFVNVDAPEHKDIDMTVATRIYTALTRANIPVEKPQILKTHQEAMKEYQACSLLLGMRMHANILAATQHIPFVGIAYEHKTMGIAKTLGMQLYCIWGHDVTTERLLLLLQTAYSNRAQIQKDITKSLISLQSSNALLWANTLNKIA